MGAAGDVVSTAGGRTSGRVGLTAGDGLLATGVGVAGTPTGVAGAAVWTGDGEAGDVEVGVGADTAGADSTTEGPPGRPAGRDTVVALPSRCATAAEPFADPLVGAVAAGAESAAEPPAVLGNAARSLRTTGASMVDDGDLTNSPSS